ncbi:MAG: protein kinase [Planctomycetes bacterium]|nr:protein kinase [Planctomycetota bacterium]
MPNPLDQAVGKLAVERGLLSQEQLDRCLALQRATVPEEKSQGLLDIACQEGFITKFQANQLDREKEKLSRKKDPVPGFRLVAEIGRGGMGQVYKAVQISLDRPVAIKVLPARLARDPAFIERFQREAVSAGKLVHPNVVQVIEAGETPEHHHYFVMEFVEGKSVQKMLQENRRLEERESLKIVRQIADALSEAHRLNLIHRDIKPANIMVTPEGVAKLADFGLARETTDTSMTQTGVMMGTPNYMSPEQAKGNRDLDIRTDLYSLGATLYHMVTGRLPFTGETATEIILKHLDAPVVPPRQIVPELSEGMNQLILRMMEKDRERRYHSPKALIEDLDRVVSGQTPQSPAVPPSLTPAVESEATLTAAPASPSPTDQADPPRLQSPTAAETPRPPSRPWMLAASAASGFFLVLLLLLAYPAWRGQRSRHQQSEPDRPPITSSTPPEFQVSSTIPQSSSTTTSSSAHTTVAVAPRDPPSETEGIRPVQPTAAGRIKELENWIRKHPEDFTGNLERLETLRAELRDSESAAKIDKVLQELQQALQRRAERALRDAQEHAQLAFKAGNFEEVIPSFDLLPEGYLTPKWKRQVEEEKKRWTQTLLDALDEAIRDRAVQDADQVLATLKNTGVGLPDAVLSQKQTELHELVELARTEKREQEARQAEEEAFSRFVVEQVRKLTLVRQFPEALGKVQSAREKKQFPHHPEALKSLEASLAATLDVFRVTLSNVQEKTAGKSSIEARIKGARYKVFAVEEQKLLYGVADEDNAKWIAARDLALADLASLAETFYQMPAMTEVERIRRLAAFCIGIRSYREALDWLKKLPDRESNPNLSLKEMALLEADWLYQEKNLRDARLLLEGLKEIFPNDPEIPSLLEQIASLDQETRSAPAKIGVSNLFSGRVSSLPGQQVKIVYPFNASNELQDWVVNSRPFREIFRKKFLKLDDEFLPKSFLQPPTVQNGELSLHPPTSLAHIARFSGDVSLKVTMTPTPFVVLQLDASRAEAEVEDGILFRWREDKTKERGHLFEVQAGDLNLFRERLSVPDDVKKLEVTVSRRGRKLEFKINSKEFQGIQPLPVDFAQDGFIAFRHLGLSDLHVDEAQVTGKLEEKWLAQNLSEKQAEIDERSSTGPDSSDEAPAEIPRPKK